MNRQTVINKFIEKAGALDPKPKYDYVQGTTKGHYGLTTKLESVIMRFRRKYWEETKKISEVSVNRVGNILPNIHREIDGVSYDFDESDILNCARMLQNSPFKDISVIIPGDTLPIAFKRSGVDISILLAPTVLDIPPPEIEHPSVIKKYKGNPWINPDRHLWQLKGNLPKCTYQVWEFDISKTNPPYKPNSVMALNYGYPIAQLIKCSNCGNEITKGDWLNRAYRDQHPECVCSCFTYDDFCGCQRLREQMVYDRIRRETTQRANFIKRSHWDVA
jgi:hypothetical protein